MSKVRVVLWGLGAMGGGIGRVLMKKRGVEVVGAIDANPRYEGSDLGAVLELGSDLGINVQAEGEAALKAAEADVCIIATSSFVDEVKPDILTAVSAGYDVITIAEEMAYPKARSPEMAKAINDWAKANGQTVLGTGINPGFILDTLIIALTGACVEVEEIVARRVNDLSPFGPTVMTTQGVGTSPEEFEAGLEAGTIVGHVGFPESMGLIADALGWSLDRIEETRAPILSKETRTGEHVTVSPGFVAGCHHTAIGYMNEKPVIQLEHPQQIEPQAAGIETGDFIEIKGTPDISMAIQPEIPGGLGTIALTCNMLPAVMAAASGLVTMADLPIPRFSVADVRDIVKTLREPDTQWGDSS